jgi:hypothetical protein
MKLRPSRLPSIAPSDHPATARSLTAKNRTVPLHHRQINPIAEFWPALHDRRRIDLRPECPTHERRSLPSRSLAGLRPVSFSLRPRRLSVPCPDFMWPNPKVWRRCDTETTSQATVRTLATPNTTWHRPDQAEAPIPSGTWPRSPPQATRPRPCECASSTEVSGSPSAERHR